MSNKKIRTLCKDRTRPAVPHLRLPFWAGGSPAPGLPLGSHAVDVLTLSGHGRLQRDLSKDPIRRIHENLGSFILIHDQEHAPEHSNHGYSPSYSSSSWVLFFLLLLLLLCLFGFAIVRRPRPMKEQPALHRVGHSRALQENGSPKRHYTRARGSGMV